MSLLYDVERAELEAKIGRLERLKLQSRIAPQRRCWKCIGRLTAEQSACLLLAEERLATWDYPQHRAGLEMLDELICELAGGGDGET